MSDPEIATKAPESDAQEDQQTTTTTNTAPTTATPSTEPAPAPALCDDCVTDRPTPAGQASTGEITKLGDVDVYISKPADYPHSPAKLLLLLTGGTGLKSVNNQIQADKFASEGFVVVMPDLFEGDPAPNSTSTTIDPDSPQDNPDTVTPYPSTAGDAPASPSFLDTFKIKAAETAKSFLIDMWLARHTEEKVMPILHKVLDAAKDEFADAVSNGGGVYAVGYCFGGRYVLLLAAERPVEPKRGRGISMGDLGKFNLPWVSKTESSSTENADTEANKPKTVGPYIKAGALAHATLVSRDDFVGLKAPVSVVCVENDPLFPDEVRTAGEDYMGKNNVEHEVQVYPGVPHGFAVVGDYTDPSIKEAQEIAYEQMLKWLMDH